MGGVKEEVGSLVGRSEGIPPTGVAGLKEVELGVGEKEEVESKLGGGVGVAGPPVGSPRGKAGEAGMDERGEGSSPGMAEPKLVEDGSLAGGGGLAEGGVSS